MILRICSPFTYVVTSWSNFSLETHHIISELNIWAKLFVPLPTLATEMLSLKDETELCICFTPKDIFKHYNM